MALRPHDQTNFETLQRAIQNGDCALAQCTDRATGDYRAVICAVMMREGQYELVPFAIMIDGNPYDQLIDPSELMEAENGATQGS